MRLASSTDYRRAVWLNACSGEGWVKYRSPQEAERELENEIQVAAQATEDAVFAKGLDRTLEIRKPHGGRAEAITHAM